MCGPVSPSTPRPCRETIQSPVCISEAAQLNGSAVALYNSTTIYDKLLWAATWMYR